MHSKPARGEIAVSNREEAQRLLELLRQTVSMIYRPLLWRKAEEIELTRSQVLVLYYIEQHPGCYMGEVAKVLDVSVSAITQVVDRLEQKRYVSRGTDPSDRRIYTLNLTSGGQAQVSELRVLQIEGLEEVLGQMAARDRKHLIKGLEALVKATGREGLPARRLGGGEVLR